MSEWESRDARRRALIQGACVAVVAGVVAGISGVLGLTAAWPVLIGAVVGLVPGAGKDLGRAGAVAVGIGAGWFGFALRATVLPDVAVGRGMALAIPVLIVAAVAVLTAQRLPLWAGVAGVATLVGDYAPAYADNPTLFLTESVTSLTSVLVAMSAGLLVGLMLRPDRPAPEPEPADRAASVPQAPPGAEVAQ